MLGACRIPVNGIRGYRGTRGTYTSPSTHPYLLGVTDAPDLAGGAGRGSGACGLPVGSVIAFHEKAGRSQGDSFW